MKSTTVMMAVAVVLSLRTTADGLALAAKSPSPESPRDSSAHIPSNMPLNAVKREGGFWLDRVRRLRDIYLPGTLDGSFMDLTNGSSLRNFLRAAGMEQHDNGQRLRPPNCWRMSARD